MGANKQTEKFMSYYHTAVFLSVNARAIYLMMKYTDINTKQKKY